MMAMQRCRLIEVPVPKAGIIVVCHPLVTRPPAVWLLLLLVRLVPSVLAGSMFQAGVAAGRLVSLLLLLPLELLLLVTW
jgi:hypothetical protein